MKYRQWEKLQDERRSTGLKAHHFPDSKQSTRVCESLVPCKLRASLQLRSWLDRFPSWTREGDNHIPPAGNG